jgi:hypothetical protein
MWASIYIETYLLYVSFMIGGLRLRRYLLSMLVLFFVAGAASLHA